MNIAYGIKGKTAEKEAYGRRKIWSREKKEQERGGMRNKMRNESIMSENNRTTMRNNSVPFYFS